MHVTAEAKNPASSVTAGIARIPAPTYGINSRRKRKISEEDKTNITVVPATRKIELVTLPGIQMRNNSITVHLKGKTSMHKEVERSMLCLTRFVLHGCLVEIGEEALQLLLRAGCLLLGVLLRAQASLQPLPYSCSLKHRCSCGGWK